MLWHAIVELAIPAAGAERFEAILDDVWEHAAAAGAKDFAIGAELELGTATIEYVVDAADFFSAETEALRVWEEVQRRLLPMVRLEPVGGSIRRLELAKT